MTRKYIVSLSKKIILGIEMNFSLSKLKVNDTMMYMEHRIDNGS